MGMQTVPAKHIVTAVETSDNYICRDYNMNIYRGCPHGCIYCDSRSECYRVERFDEVRVKENALAVIGADLRSKRKTGIVATGAMSAPYNPFEEELRLTRGALELIDRFGFGVTITTKSSLIARDADVFKSIARHSPADARLTITTVDDSLAGLIEPHAPPPSARLEALAHLARSGVFTGVFITPVLPMITDTVDGIVAILRRAAEAGAKSAVMFPGMTLRAGSREHYNAALDRHFPGLSERYRRAYGDRYECWSDNARALTGAFVSECDKLGLLHDFRDINRAVRASAEPLRLF